MDRQKRYEGKNNLSKNVATTLYMTSRGSMFKLIREKPSKGMRKEKSISTKTDSALFLNTAL